MDDLDIQIDASLFGELFDAAPDPIIIVRGDGRIAMVNAETIRKFGFSREELIGQTIEVIVPMRFRKQHVDQRLEYSKEPKTRPMGSGTELFACRKDGVEIPVEISLSPFNTSTSSTSSTSLKGSLVISILRDITDRKNAERALREKAEELARSNTELEQFAYIASHDLQEPLRAIAGSCQLLQRRAGDQLDEDSKTFIGFAVDGAKRMQALISDLLNYSRVTTKAKPLEPLSCEAALKQVLAGLSAQIEETGAVVTHDPLPEIVGDATQMNQILQNLISNGIKFHDGKPPTVHISAERKANEWVFSVRDNGIGIDPKYFDRIFVIFKRLHNREEYDGTGIGLALCKKIVERHGGEIWVDSESGKGATFRFTIPIR